MVPTADEALNSPFLITFDFTQAVHTAENLNMGPYAGLPAVQNALLDIGSMHRNIKFDHSAQMAG